MFVKLFLAFRVNPLMLFFCKTFKYMNSLSCCLYMKFYIIHSNLSDKVSWLEFSWLCAHFTESIFSLYLPHFLSFWHTAHLFWDFSSIFCGFLCIFSISSWNSPIFFSIAIILLPRLLNFLFHFPNSTGCYFWLLSFYFWSHTFLYLYLVQILYIYHCLFYLIKHYSLWYF